VFSKREDFKFPVKITPFPYRQKGLQPSIESWSGFIKVLNAETIVFIQNYFPKCGCAILLLPGLRAKEGLCA